jgi:putative intracellular protease/amidase
MRKPPAAYRQCITTCKRGDGNAVSPLACAGSGLPFSDELPDTPSMLKEEGMWLASVLLLTSWVSSVAIGQQPSTPFPETASKLADSAKGRIKVAFVVTDQAVMIDYAGPWEVFQDVMVLSRGGNMENQHVFDLYTVSDTTAPLRTSGGMRVIPDYTFDNAPQPNVVVVPAQLGHSQKMIDWLRAMAKRSDVVMSVCTGAFELGEAGLLNGKKATTHHGAYVKFQHDFPAVTLVRNMRYVQSDPVVFTAGGLSSGIDLALHIVELYFGRDVAAETARTMEYEGKGWMGDGSAAQTWSVVQTAHASDHFTSGVFGNWEGNLTTPDGTFRIAVHLWPDSAGNPAGSLDSVEQDVVDRPLLSPTFKNSILHFEVKGAEGSFDGTLSQDESTIAGTWAHDGTSTRLDFKRGN